MRITQPDFLHLISEEHLRPGDALHLYTADLLQPDLLVTADLNQLKVAKSNSLDVS